MKESAKNLDLANESLQKYAKPTIAVGEKGEAVWPAYYLARDIAPVVHQKNALRALDFTEPFKGYKCELKVEPDDFEKLRNLRNIIDLIHFDTWFTIAFKSFFEDPIKLQWLRKIYPDYFEAREKEIIYMANLKKLMLTITMHGAKTKKELEFIYWLKMNPDALNFIRRPIKMEKVPEDIRNIDTLISREQKSPRYHEGILFKALGPYRRAEGEWAAMFDAGEKILSGDIPWSTLRLIHQKVRKYSHSLYLKQKKGKVGDKLKAMQTYQNLMGILVPNTNIEFISASETPIEELRRGEYKPVLPIEEITRREEYEPT